MKQTRRNPIQGQVNEYQVDSPAPANINYFWGFGSLLGQNQIVLIISGITLAMHYTPNTQMAFNSVEHIMRDVNNGWLIRYIHANGASFFFIFVYQHIGRGLYYGSYRSPRGQLWSIGVVIYILMMATAFIGKLNCLKWYNFTSNFFKFIISFFLQVLTFNIWIIEPIINLQETNLNFSNELVFNTAVISINNLPNFLKGKKIYKNLDTVETQLQIRNENRQKAGIYCVFNTVNHNFYIGSAITNRINTRFRNHCIHGSSNIYLRRAIDKYGLNVFIFSIQEYFPGIILKENLKKSHIVLQDLETKYIKELKPKYNILTLAHSSEGYRHTEETKKLMSENYSDERKLMIGNLNKDKIYSDEERSKLREIAYVKYKNQPEQRERISQAQSKSVILYNLDGTIHSEYKGIRKMAKNQQCCHKTINKCIKNNTNFKTFGKIKQKL